MIKAFKCEDEAGRVRALKRFDVLDTPKEPAFEKIVNLVQQIMEVPICAVSLVDCERQWFKASRGLDVTETPRDISFCTHTVRRAEPLAVADAMQDRIFANNPLVTGDPHIRSYLGIPLITADGYGVGSLCVIDVVPRTYTDRQVQILSDFAEIVMNELELRQGAGKDPLTGILGRASWEDVAAAEVRRSNRYGNSLSIAIFDLDRFKCVNESYGHLIGDDVIRLFAALGSRQIRDTDILGRFGGEEFLLLLPETSCQQALSIVERVRIAFSETPVQLDNDAELLVTVSAGVTSLRGNETVSDLVRRADHALYEAKRAGRNCTMVDHLIPLEPAISPREMAG
jgi:diguanylate cyclase (GGDEF)-like protein